MIVAPVPFWKRPEVSCIFWDNIEYQKSKGLDIEVVAIVSDEVNQRLAKHYTDHIVKASNFNIGVKWNQGLEYCKQLDFTHLLILGSDDIFSKNLIDAYLVKDRPYIGLKDATAMSLVNGNVKHFEGYTDALRRGESVGSGRMITKEVVNKAGYKLFKPLNKGLDLSMTQRLSEIGYSNHLITTGLTPLRIGLKVENCISGMNGSFNHRLSDDDLLKHYSKGIVEQIREFGKA
jgi:hypothetical protein